MTYNVRRCTGLDGQCRPDRIAEIISEMRPDIAALQELDVNRKRTGRVDQLRALAERTGMTPFFYPRLQIGEELYGIGLLSRWPIRVVRAAELPTGLDEARVELTVAVWASVDVAGKPFQVINTHFFHPLKERAFQADALMGPDWLRHPECRPPFALCGDLNTSPFSFIYRRLRGVLRDVQKEGGSPLNTWPGLLPVVRLDHIFVSEKCAVKKFQVPRTRKTCIASDHLPLIADLLI